MPFMEGMDSRPVTRKKTFSGFNWKNIEDNGDGTFTAYDGKAKKRILKEYHRQGITVRSRKQDDGTWTIYPVGTRQPRYARRYQSPRYPRRPASYQAYPRRMQYSGPPPRLSPTASPGSIPIRRGNRTSPVRKKFDEIGEKRYQKRKESESGPYIVDEKGNTKLRPGYLEYKDKYGNIGTVRANEPTGFFERHLESQSIKQKRHEARVQQSQKIEKEMALRSSGPSTRIPGDEIFSRNKPQKPMQTLTPAPQPGIRNSAALATTQLPKGVGGPQKVSQPKLANDIAETREARINKISSDL